MHISNFIGFQEQLRPSVTSSLLQGEQVPFQAPYLMLRDHTNVVSTEEGTQFDPGHSSVCYSYSSTLLVAALSCLNSPHRNTTMFAVLLLQSFTSNQPTSKAAVLWHLHIFLQKTTSHQFARPWLICHVCATCCHSIP